jgi:hypothetical protein
MEYACYLELITSTDSSNLETVQRKFVALCCIRYFVGVCCNNYKIILVRLNLRTLYSRRRHFDALFLTNVFKSIISCSSLFDSVSVRIPNRIIRDYSTFIVNHNFTVSPSARCVSSTIATCKVIDIFKDFILLTDDL